MSGAPRRWSAPIAPAPINAVVAVPGSKSETNRALILAALAEGPSVITGGLEARDTSLMREALRTLGVEIIESGDQWQVNPPKQFTAGGTIDCGLAGTVMRFVPPIAALAGRRGLLRRGRAGLRPADGGDPGGADGDRRPGSTTTHRRLPFTLRGDPRLRGGVVTVDASSSSQFVSGLLLAGARYAEGIDVRHQGGPIPSLPHIDMTVAMLRERGVAVDDTRPNRWVVAPGPIAAVDVTIEPDLSNAAPFLAAAAITGGTVTVPHWPSRTNQPGDAIRDVLQTIRGQSGAAERKSHGPGNQPHPRCRS